MCEYILSICSIVGLMVKLTQVHTHIYRCKYAYIVKLHNLICIYDPRGISVCINKVFICICVYMYMHMCEI